MLCKAAINSVSHLFRAQWVCLKAQNSTIVATVKCLGHISWWGAQKEHIFISQSSLSPSLFANHSGLQLYTSLHHLSACMYVHQPELSPSLSTLFLSVCKPQQTASCHCEELRAHLKMRRLKRACMFISQSSLSLSPLSFCLQTTVGCKYTCLDHLSAFLKTFLDPAGLQCLHTCMHLWPHEAHTDVYILYIILGLIFKVKLLLTTAVHIWFPTSFYFSTQTANIPWHLNILIYIYMHHDHSNTLTKAQSFKWKKKKVLSLRTPVVHRKSQYDPLCRVRVSIHIFI